MTDENAKVAEIRGALLSEAQDEAARIVGEAKGAVRAALERARAEADAEAAAREKAAGEEAERLRRSRIAGAASAARTRLLSARAAILEEAVAAAGERLDRLRADGNYAEYLKAMLVEAALALAPAEDLEVLIDARDGTIVTEDFLGSVEIVLTFSHNLATKLRLAPERVTTAGGVVVRVRGGTLRCDNTFEERLRAARPDLFAKVAAEVLG